MLPNQSYYEREEIRVITYVNSKDAKLFELAAAELGVESLDVDQYLNKLSELKAISPRFVRLPLYEEGHEDEEIFLINANERTIKIPSSFSKNGVGVVSDEFAEILWFKINRYFDIKDFGKASEAEVLKDGDLHILIQWEAPDGAKGASFAYAIDKDTDPDYIYFGWAITADHLTAKAGNIRFAVRIMEYGADGIEYSFATQAAAVAVKANLNFDLTDEDVVIENVGDKIASRLMQGQIAHCPVFAEDGDLDAYVVDLEVPVGAPEGTPASAILSVNAAAPEGDSYDAMAYKWYKKGANDAEFKQIEGEYSPALTVTSSGQYYVVVFGMKEIVDNEEYTFDGENVSEEPVKFKYHTSVASSKSTVCVIPAPIKLDIQPFVDPEDPSKILGYMARKFVIGKDGELMILINRQKIADATVGEVELRFEKTANAEKELDLEAAEFTVVDLTSAPGQEAVTEAWILDEVEYASEEEAKAAADAAQGAEAGAGDYSGIIHREAKEAVPAVEAPITYTVDEGNISIDMSNAEEGYYKITVINKLNGDQEETVAFNTKAKDGVEEQPIAEIVCRVVKPAKVDSVALQLLDGTGADSSTTKPSVHGNNQIKAMPTIEGLSDEIEYQWYKVVGVQDGSPEDEGFDILIENAKEQIYKPDDDGTYYCKVINRVEDTEDIKDSATVVFTA